MRPFALLFLASIVAVCSLASGEAAAQPPPGRPVYIPGQPVPVVSPYLNLFRRGSSLANNYYNLVVPQVNTASDIQRLQAGVATNQSIVEAALAASGDLGPTGGRIPGFNTHRGFFNNRGGARTGTPPPLAPAPTFPSAGGTGLYGGTLDPVLIERERQRLRR